MAVCYMFIYFEILCTRRVCDGFRTINIAQRFMTIRHGAAVLRETFRGYRIK